MQFRNLGKSGLCVSLIGLERNNLGGRIDLAASRQIVHRALDLGITLLDTADIYGTVPGQIGRSEAALGDILGDRGKDVVLATMFGMELREERDFRGCGSRRYIMTTVEASLRRLIKRWENEDVLDWMKDRLDRTPEAMGVRRQTVEHPFGTLKAWMGATHFLTRTLDTVRTEMSLHVLAYNLKRMIAILGAESLMAAIRT